jgi:hypothetical protein
MGIGGEALHRPRQTMTSVILLQSAESADWEMLPGSYDSFQDARDMVQFIRSSYGASASFAIEHVDDLSRKGYSIA